VLVCARLVLAVVSGSAQEHLERGYTQLLQARLASTEAAREGLLSAVIAACKEAYQLAGPTTQTRALLGAAQAYLLMQSPRRVFPFLWQATPLQRAEKSLQQALFLHPDDAAAALLLGIVYWRQATTVAGPQADILARGQHYLAQAARHGLPVRLPSATTPDAGAAHTFGVEDSLLLLQYVDARGSGRAEDLVLLYRAAPSRRVFGVVVTAGQAYALTTDVTTGVLAPDGFLEAMSVTPQPGSAPFLTLRWRQDARPVDLRFTWDGRRFVPLPVVP
jgi:hypothetical protein